MRAGADVASVARDPPGGGALGGLRPSPLPPSPDTHSASCLCRPVLSAAAALTCSCRERPPGGEGPAALGVGLSGPGRRRDPPCPPLEGGYPGNPEPARRSPRGRAAAPVLLAFSVGGSRPRCRRCPSGACWGRRKAKPGLSSGLPSRAWPCLLHAPEEIWTCRWGYGAGWAGASGLRSLQPRKGLTPSLGSQNRREEGTPQAPSVRRSRELRSKRLKIISPQSQGLGEDFTA